MPPIWNQHPELLPILPILYIAWSDGELTPDELLALRDHAADVVGEDRIQGPLDAWLDPASPPSPTDLRELLRFIQESVSNTPEAHRMGLAELGLSMAKLSDVQVFDWVNDSTRDALFSLESALGVIGNEATRQILQPPRPSRPVEPEHPPAFDIDAMTAVLDGDLTDIRRKVRALLEQNELFRHVSPDIDKATYREQVKTWLLILAEQGLGALAYPETLKRSTSLAEFVGAFETLACFDLSLVVKYGVQFGLFGGSIYFLGRETHRERYLDDVARGRLLGCFAMTELGHGSNVRDLETTATYDPETDTLVVHTPSEGARKEYIGNAACHAQLASVFAQLIVDGESYGVHAVLVPIRDDAGQLLPGVQAEDCGHKMGLNGVDNGRLWFDQVRVPRENLLNRFGTISDEGRYESDIPSEGRRFFTMLSTLVGGRVAVASASLTVAQSALSIAVRYGSRRRQFGPEDAPEVALLDYSAHQRRLMPLLARAYALRFALHRLVGLYVAERDEEATRKVEALAAGLKAYASWFATEAVQVCRECCGGQGYMSANRFAALKADSDVFTTFEGDNTVLLQLVAKGLLTDFKRQFANISFMGVMRFVSSAASNALLERNPITTRRTDPEHLRDPEVQRALFDARRDDLLRSVARRLKSRLDKGMDSFQAFNACQNHLLDLAKASVEARILQDFTEAANATSDPAIQSTLHTLRSLFALSHVASDAGWFLENGYIESSKAAAIRREVERLCAETRDQAIPLIEAFAIPDTCLAAPIALGDTID